ncbi:hypothetical protein HQ531_15450 [bacterium]|nr:hypothetical protein [bacterium]
MKNIKIFWITLGLISSSVMGWYPEYSVMASDFVLGKQFLAPIGFHSMSVYGLGEGFQDLYSSPMDDISANPAVRFDMVSKHFFQLDLGGQELFDDDNPFPGRTFSYAEYDSYVMVPWSQYRQTEEKEDYDPAFRFFYLGYPIEQMAKTRFGLSFDWVYGISEFYQPYDDWGFRYLDAMGASYENSGDDPYDDYNLRQAGDDENINQGYRLSFLLAHPLTSNTQLGLRYTVTDEKADGSLWDFNSDDQNDYYDVFVSYYDSNTERKQTFKSNDIMLGIDTRLQSGAQLGISAGLLFGDLDRDFNQRDSSMYYYLFLDQYADISLDDSTFYSSQYNHRSEKAWDYDGRTIYGGLQYRSTGANGIQYRFSIQGEQRVADLIESESMLQNSNYENRYFSYYDTSVSEYTSLSWAIVERSGTGKLEQQIIRGTGGIDWNVSPTFRFLGGLHLRLSDRKLTAKEPFSGEKYAFTERAGGYYYDGTDVHTQIDEKEFSWERNEREIYVGLPVGFIFKFGQYFKIQSGLTKIFRKTDISENYDVIVERYYHVRDNNGVITSVDDSDYVDGYKFPDVKTFDNGFDFNSGLSFVFADNFAATVALTNAFTDNYSLKLGARVSW